jgi:periplasmic protein TonB
VTLERGKAEPCPANFGLCLVEGTQEEKRRGRKIRRRAIAVSVALQATGVAALVMAPLFAKPAALPYRIVLPVPSYSGTRPARSTVRPPVGHTIRPLIRGIFFPPTHAPDKAGTPETQDGPAVEGMPPAEGAPPTGLIDVVDTHAQPPPPPPHVTRRISDPHISPALLVHRVEPVYPALARQIRRSGRVELHALIAADGTVQSLEVVSGDPLFNSSALEGVRQWRYRPTVLNGTAVEVDTYITVIYTLQ